MRQLPSEISKPRILILWSIFAKAGEAVGPDHVGSCLRQQKDTKITVIAEQLPQAPPGLLRLYNLLSLNNEKIYPTPWLCFPSSSCW